MKKILIISLIFIWTSIAFGQTKVNYEQIKMNINNSASDLFYTTLFKRYIAGDSTLTLEQKRHCYYGYIFQEKYDPYKRAKTIDLVDSTIKNQLEKIDTAAINLLIDSALNSYPFDLKALLYKKCFSINSSNESKIAISRIGIILNAIKSTGDGLKKGTSYSVIYIPHEMLLLNSLGLTPSGEQQLEKDDIDVLYVNKNERGMKKMYFDISSMKTNENPRNILFHQFYHAFMNRHPLDFKLIE